MADYHAVLLRTLDGLGQTTPQLRAKLYERARITIGKQLESAKPPMAAKAIATQKAHLEAAIASIESEYQGSEQGSAAAQPAPAPAANPQPTPAPPAVEPMSAPMPVSPSAGSQTAPASPAQGVQGTQIPQNLPSAAAESVAPAMPSFRNEEPVADLVPEFGGDPVGIPAAEDEYFEPSAAAQSGARSGRLSTIIMAVVGVIIIGGGATALWANRGSLSESYDQMVGGSGTMKVTSSGSQSGSGSNSSDASPIKNGNGLAASTTVEATNVEKYDQRLNSDGKEVAPAPILENNDNLPVGVEPSPVTTTRIVVPDNNGSRIGQPVVGNGTLTAATTPDTGNASSGPVIAQKGFLYEEGSARGKNTVDVGSVVWSVVQEAPGEGLPLEPAIRAKVEIGSRGLILLVTIKRNADAALPASHLIELVFSVPDDFVGGTIDKVQRFVFKESEEARGEALVGVPATIADGIFLIALNNLPQAVERNTQLMKGREWIDIPLGYRTGRRALITLEKGIPGDRVFNEVFAAWSTAG